jgi:stage IV sporulation protein B
MSIRTRYRLFLYVMLIGGITGIIYLTGVFFDKNIPDKIIIHENNEKTLDFNIPFTGVIESSESRQVQAINLNEPVVIRSGSQGTYQLKLKLFGIFEYKNVDIDVVGNRTLYACGNTIGLYLKSNGVLVIDTGSFSNGIEDVSPSKGILFSGDYILAVNDELVESKADLIEKVAQNGEKDIVLTIRRNGSESRVKVTPQKDQTGSCKLGVWVKDDCQGIGTLTYIDEYGNFGALGHGICDSDTGTLLEIEGGVLYKANVLSVIKGRSGVPGEYVGTINYSEGNVLGYIEQNSNLGIYGISNGKMDSGARLLEAGYKSDTHVGTASILTSINGTVEEFEIEILELDYSAGTTNKGIVFKVTDEDLLSRTNGIVQGQSGSPIIQDGRLVGAVTHVFVNDSSMGYGIFLETMLNASNN